MFKYITYVITPFVIIEESVCPVFVQIYPASDFRDTQYARARDGMNGLF